MIWDLRHCFVLLRSKRISCKYLFLISNFSTSTIRKTHSNDPNIDGHLSQSCACEDDPLDDQLFGINAYNLGEQMLKAWKCNNPMISKQTYREASFTNDQGRFIHPWFCDHSDYSIPTRKTVKWWGDSLQWCLCETNIAPARLPERNYSFQPSIFRCYYVTVVWGRAGNSPKHW